MTEEQRLHQLRSYGDDYARAKATREYLEHFRKSKLAILMKVYAERGFATTAAQEREARADDEYLEVLHGLREATETAEKLWWQLKVAQAGVDVWRTKQANERAEAKAYGVST